MYGNVDNRGTTAEEEEQSLTSNRRNHSVHSIERVFKVDVPAKALELFVKGAYSFRNFNVLEAMCQLSEHGELKRICLDTGNRALIVDLAWLERELGTDEVHKLPRPIVFSTLAGEKMNDNWVTLLMHFPAY
jgi:hypothetical protein